MKEGVADSWQEDEVWRMELYLSTGIMALCLLSLLAIASLPSVADALNWREFTFVQVRSNAHTQEIGRLESGVRNPELLDLFSVGLCRGITFFVMISTGFYCYYSLYINVYIVVL